MVGHHEEGAPEQREVVAQTLCTLRRALLSHLWSEEARWQVEAAVAGENN